jgi:transposase
LRRAACRGYAGTRGQRVGGGTGGRYPRDAVVWPALRLRLRASAPKGFAPVRIAPELPAGAGTLEIEFATGARMRISGAVDIAVMAAAVAALARGRRR